MDSDFDYLLGEFSLFDHNELRAILKDSKLFHKKMVFYFLCRLLIEETKVKVNSRELISYIVEDLREKGINIVGRGNLYFVNDSIINPSFINDPSSKSQKGQFNPHGWFGASITNHGKPVEIKKADPGFDERWLDFVGGYGEEGKPYEYWLLPDKHKVVRKAVLSSLKNESRKREILHKTIEYNLDEKDLELVKKLLVDRNISITERESIVRSRIGQGQFREDLKEVWEEKCSATRLSMTEVLKASHIKPWRDSDNFERLDPYNGLLLAPNVDSLFDRFLISFDHEGKIMISPTIDSESLGLLGIDSEMRLSKVEKEHKNYLKYHRQRFNSIAENKLL
jgi:hypothetical protein